MTYPLVPIRHLVKRVESLAPSILSRSTFRYIDISSIDRDQKCIARTSEIATGQAPSRARQLVQQDDVLVSTVRPNLNAVALVSRALNGEIASTGFCVLRANSEILNARFLFYFVRTDAFVSSLLQHIRGANYPAVTDASVKAVSIPVPPLSEQRRIVEILDQANVLLTQRTNADAKAHRILPALFIKLFGDPATNPKMWPQGTLASFGNKIRYGLSQPPELAETNGLPLIRATNIHAGTITEANLVYVDQTSVPVKREAYLAPEEVIVVRSGAYTGDVAQVTEKWKGAIIGYDLVVTPAKGWTGEFIEQYLLTPFIQTSYFAAQKSRAGQPHLNSAQLGAAPSYSPPHDLQAKFAAQVRAVRRTRSNGFASLDHLKSISSSLNLRAFSGQLTTHWRDAHMKELLAEIEDQARTLKLAFPKELEKFA